MALAGTRSAGAEGNWGDKEIEDGTVSVSKRGQGDIGSMNFDDFANMLKNEIDDKVR